MSANSGSCSPCPPLAHVEHVQMSTGPELEWANQRRLLLALSMWERTWYNIFSNHIKASRAKGGGSNCTQTRKRRVHQKGISKYKWIFGTERLEGDMFKQTPTRPETMRIQAKGSGERGVSAGLADSQYRPCVLLYTERNSARFTWPNLISRQSSWFLAVFFVLAASNQSKKL